RDAAGQPLALELRTTAQYDVQRDALLAVTNAWQSLGLGMDPVTVPLQQQRDAAYRATFPAFELLNGPPSDIQGVAGYRSGQARTAQNNYTGSNYPRYQNPQLDALIDRY